MESSSLMLLLVNLAAIMERADEALLPAVYDQAFGVSPSALGSLTFIRALVQALASPLAAYLALSHNRVNIIAAGALAWAVATAALGLCNSFWQIHKAAIVKAFNGIGLAIVIPAIQSIVADIYAENERGFGFGWLHAAGQLGNLLGGVFATLLAGRMVLGIAGWRFVFLFVALLSLMLGLAICHIGREFVTPSPVRPISGEGEALLPDRAYSKLELKELWKGTLMVLRVPTFQVIVGQGVVGQVPWNAMAFFTLWLELLGFGHGSAALLVALLSIGNMFGSVFGGWLGDLSSRIAPNSGRIFCSQFSAGSGIPLSALLLLVVPQRVDYGWLYGLILFSMGFFMSWNSPATNWPIFAEIVPAHLHTTVYAFDLTIEKSIGAAGTPLVGLFAERLFGYDVDESSFASDLGNARALAKGLFAMISFPFLLVILGVNFLYFTYPKDRENAKSNSQNEVFE